LCFFRATEPTDIENRNFDGKISSQMDTINQTDLEKDIRVPLKKLAGTSASQSDLIRSFSQQDSGFNRDPEPTRCSITKLCCIKAYQGNAKLNQNTFNTFAAEIDK
jgi:hypothetical protein